MPLPKFGVQAVVEGLDKYISDTRAVETANAGVSKSMQTSAKSATEGGRGMEIFTVAAKGVGVALVAAAGSIEMLNRGQQEGTKSVNRLASETGLATETIRQMAIDVANTGDSLSEMTNIMEIGAQQGLRSAEALKTYAGFWDNVADATGGSGEALAKAGVALQAVGIDVENQSEALAALGFIQTSTTIGVEAFLDMIQRKAPAITEMGLTIDQVAALMGILEAKGLTGRAAMMELQAAIDSSNGSMSAMLSTLGISATQFAEYEARVAASGGAIDSLAAANNSAFTPMQNLKHALDELLFAYAEQIDHIASFATILGGIAPLMMIVRAAWAGGAAVLALLTGTTTTHAGAAGLDAVAIEAEGTAAAGAATKLSLLGMGLGSLVVGLGIASGASLGLFKVLRDQEKATSDATAGTFTFGDALNIMTFHLSGTASSAEEADQAVMSLTDASIAGRFALNDYGATSLTAAANLGVLTAAAQAAAYAVANANIAAGAKRTALEAAMGSENYMGMGAFGINPNEVDATKVNLIPYGTPGGPGYEAPKTGGGGGKQDVSTSLEGFLSATTKSAVESAYGELGNAAMEAFNTALAESSSSNGQALGKSMQDLIDQAKEEGVPNWKELGDALSAALADGLTTGVGDGVSAALTAMNEAIKEQGELTPENFAKAFAAASRESDLIGLVGSAGKSFMDAFSKEIEDGSAKNLQTLATSARKMVDSLEEELPPEQAEYLAGEFMTAMDKAVAIGGEAGIASMRMVLATMNDIMEGGAIDIKTHTVILAEDIDKLAKNIGISAEDVRKNIGLFAQEGMLGVLAGASNLTKDVKEMIQETLRELNEGIIDAKTAAAEIKGIAAGAKGSDNPYAGTKGEYYIDKFSGHMYASYTDAKGNKSWYDTALFGLPASGGIQGWDKAIASGWRPGDGTPMPQYGEGTPYVPRTGLAIVHEGERITPAWANLAARAGGTTNSSSRSILFDFRGAQLTGTAEENESMMLRVVRNALQDETGSRAFAAGVA